MADDDVQATPARAKSGSKKMQVLVVALLMIGEGVAIYLLTNALGQAPASAVAAGAGPGENAIGVVTDEQLTEVELAECRPSNKMSGKLINFHVRVSVLVAAEDRERVEKMAKARRARLLDRIQFVFRSADLKHLNEPALETVKRRLKHEFDRVFGDDELIMEVLIPERQQSGSGV